MKNLFKGVLYIVLSMVFMNCYNYFVFKYKITNLDNILMVFALNFSMLCWIEIF